MTLADFDAELVARGFDGFTPAQRYRYINWGYRGIAKRYTWYWEQTTSTFNVNPGDAPASLATVMPSFRSLNALLVTTNNYRRSLDALDDERFFNNYLPLDLQSAANRGEPQWYYIYNTKLYLLPPPNATRAFEAHFKQRIPDLVNPADTPITPVHLEEAILLASIARCHKRAQEVGLAQVAQMDLEEFLDDMRTDEELIMAEQLDRIQPDDTWL